MSWKDVPANKETPRIDSTQSDFERNQELSRHTNSAPEQTANRVDRTAPTNRKNQPTRQSSLSDDLKQFRKQQQEQQRAISRDAKRRAKTVQRTDNDRQSTNNRRTQADKQHTKEQQRNPENFKRQPKPDRSKDYGPSR